MSANGRIEVNIVEQLNLLPMIKIQEKSEKDLSENLKNQTDSSVFS